MNVTAAMTRPERVDSATKRFCETLSSGTGLPEIAQMMIGMAGASMSTLGCAANASPSVDFLLMSCSSRYFMM